ncbi:MAG: sulfotransferase family 2 domain-containing protein, partial [Silvanigrellaceae bacterium]|nr:sulfotransferase family 2 domain-containing protein [Silvanigrellaceae bacterium]
MNKFFSLFFLSILWINQLNGRLYYIHIPKTGGSTIRTLIESKVHLSELYPRRMPKREQNQPETPLSQEIVSGHFPLWFCDQIDENFDKAYKFTVLREPVDRYLSFLRYRKRNNPSFTSLENVLETISQTDDRSNLLCKFLTSNQHLTGQDLLQNAK